jgi:AcrR family transcriptional regulator
MKSKKTNPVKGGSAEEKIKEAARKLFTQKGFAAVKTRDIAEEAGINLALLNYYFRSKQKLFDMIMLENLQQFIQGSVFTIISDRELTFEKKIEKIVDSYVNMLTENPDLPFFILNEMKSNPVEFGAQMEPVLAPMRIILIKELQQDIDAGKIAAIHPFHFLANLVGLTVFPFIARPLLQKVTNVSNHEFNKLIQERKKLVPLWISAILKPV